MSTSSDRDVTRTADSARNLQQMEVERLQKAVDRLRSWMQFLAGGLALALFIALAISGWLTYSLEVQRRNAHREREGWARDRQALVENLQLVQDQLTLLQERTEADLAKLQTRAQDERQLLLQLQERLENVSRELDAAPSSNTTVDELNRQR